jgi:hypothetical protein
MYTGQLEQLARQRIAELPATPPATSASRPPVQASPGKSLRTSTGWAIVAIGLRIASSGSR